MDGEHLDDDYVLALQLQEQFDNELSDAEVEYSGGPVVPWKPERPLSIVDASWETLDPTPDVRAMFLEFNNRFFWGKLSGVEVKWSPRMTLCAGVCSYEGRGGLCSIRLSEPLLKLRPRKDLVETLLHEMIHALLFVTQNDRDRDGHGPEFCKHMNRINKDSGTNITIYHDFNDEVDVYRQHWWRCDGPCQNRKPYFGYVKRAMNRAPSSLDPWWGDHQRTCGGTYTKVKEPEGYGQKGKKKREAKTGGKLATMEKPAGSRDIRDVIAFSGKGFVLGRNPMTSPSPASSSVSKPVTSSPPSRVFPAIGSPTPAKKSVGNTKFFVNINGSPVRLPDLGVSGRGSSISVGSGKQEDSKKLKQTLLDSLFNKSPSKLIISDSSSESNSPIWIDQTPSTSSQHSNDKLTTWKKRPLDETASVYDLFNKKLKVESKQDEESTARSSATSVSEPSSSSSMIRMVNCPICQASVQESKINEHLDICLC
ncbi:DNA-dependent metalloprotease SPRTN [Corythoichthys intestinalis]|uniref:DNA-dependent metalloprotease SPRTN n=1 Tax=Corythoichthys intestinalis TaxID=161448 RepID=UPI0025A5442B|nr:DNA-dependent metalloprotease SPRTN [Corythoichthys intestinalis]XP_061806416.1 DNA-dependent metalloprotease SPRTN-like [Nerophis lumbriciformis]